jgi:hypothetical protein
MMIIICITWLFYDPKEAVLEEVKLTRKRERDRDRDRDRETERKRLYPAIFRESSSYKMGSSIGDPINSPT